MAESRFNRFGSGPTQPPRPGGAGGTPRPKQHDQISCRATNPLSLNDDLGKVFLDERQAKATTATRLFRNDELFAAMTKVVIPSFMDKNRGGKFTMWSTGCSSGEEVYSMALVAIGEFERAKRTPFIEAFGTDINPNRIMEGRAGVYTRPSKDAFSQNYWRLLTAYAHLTDREVHMSDKLREMCKFTLFDMRKRPKKHTFHFIVCNHVFQYYDAAGQRHIIENLKAVLRPGGHMYLEGITEQGLEGSRLKKLNTAQNLYVIEGGGMSAGGGLSSPLFRKPGGQ